MLTLYNLSTITLLVTQPMTILVNPNIDSHLLNMGSSGEQLTTGTLFPAISPTHELFQSSRIGSKNSWRPFAQCNVSPNLILTTNSGVWLVSG